MNEQEPSYLKVPRTSIPRAEMAEGPKDYYPELFQVSQFILRRYFDISVVGKEHILGVPAVYAANHVAFADSLAMSMIHTEEQGVPMRFVVKQEYLDGGGLNERGRLGRSTKWFMEHTLQIPVDRERKDGGASAISMVRKVIEAKKRGESTGIHPGGTRIDESNGLPRFNDGVGLIALQAGMPVVPVSLQYGEREEGRFKKIPLTVRYGEPVMPGEFAVLSDPDKEEISIDAAEARAAKRLTSTEKVRLITKNVEHRVAEMLQIQRTGVKAQLKKYRDQK